MHYYGLPDRLQKLYKKRVLLRVDWNVSFDEHNEIDDFRIKASIKTIEWLVEQGTYLIIATHWSRPIGFEYRYSTSHFIKILKRYGYTITFIPTVSLIEEYLEKGGNIFLLENIRFLPHEKTCSQLLARTVFSYVDVFVQDGFGILAKEACFTTILPTLFDKKDRCIGFLIEKELSIIDSVRNTDPLQNALLIGGAKVPEKLMALQGGLSIASKIALLPPLVATYQAAFGLNYEEKTTIFKDLFPLVRTVCAQAKKRNVEILVPVDFQVKTKQGIFKFVACDEVDHCDQIVGIGPNTVNYYARSFCNLTNVFMTGISGFIAQKESWYTGSMFFNAIEPQVKRIIAGGDTVALMQRIFGTNPYNTLFLTGGSASFNYLSTGHLIGLSPFKKEGTSRGS